MGVLSVALSAEFRNQGSMSRLTRAPQRSALVVRPALFVALLASPAFTSAPHAAPSETVDTAATDKASYDNVSRYPLRRGYICCLIGIEYFGDGSLMARKIV